MDVAFWETIDFSEVKKRKYSVNNVELNYIFPEYGVITELENITCIGVDPGINFGVTFLSNGVMAVIWGSLPGHHEFPGIEAMMLGSQMILNDTPWSAVFENTRQLIIRVEGAAFSERFGQPLLEQVRFGFMYGMTYKTLKWPVDVKYLQPNSARLQAFGHGEVAGKNLWPNLNQNAADSIGLAIAAAKQVAD